MRDRTLAMKWVEAVAAECSGGAGQVLEKMTARGVSQNTIDDQMRRLKKQGLIIGAAGEAVAVEQKSARSKPFRPVPKSGAVKKKI